MKHNAYCSLQQRIHPDAALLETTRKLMRQEAADRRRRFNRSLGIGTAACTVAVLLGVVAPWLAQPQVQRQLLAHPDGITSAQTESKLERPDISININEITGVQSVSIDQKLAFPENALTKELTQEEAIRYLGRDVRPQRLPVDLKQEENEVYLFVELPDGSVVYDQFTFWFREDSEEEYNPLCRQLTLTASKTGLVSDCVYLYPQAYQKSYIGDVEIKLGHQEVEYGPYDEQTHAPAGTYDRYVAELTVDGVECELVADNFTQQEFTDALISMISTQSTPTP